jgi:hypothetical protein
VLTTPVATPDYSPTRAAWPPSAVASGPDPGELRQRDGAPPEDYQRIREDLGL